MALVRPFRSLHYSFASAEAFSKWVAPPYDVISRSKKEELTSRDPYNAIRIILGDPSICSAEELADPGRYEQAANTFQSWRQNQILLYDDMPSMYLIEDTFVWQNEMMTRQGILLVVKLENFPSKSIFPHEKTLQTPIEDRSKLTRALQAQESPVYFTCPGSEAISKTFLQVSSTKPLVEFQNQDEPIRHKIWQIVDPFLLHEISSSLENQPFLIADGHHRYSTALKYSEGEGKKMEEAQWILGLIAPSSQPGVVLGAIHRRIISSLTIESILVNLKKSFMISDAPLSWNSFTQSDSLLALHNPKKEILHLLRPLRPSSNTKDRIPSLLLNDQVVGPIFKIDLNNPEDQKKIIFEKVATSVLEPLKEKTIDFWLKPIHVPDIIELAQAGNLLPQKSTFFYPKVMSGFAFHPFSD